MEAGKKQNARSKKTYAMFRLVIFSFLLLCNSSFGKENFTNHQGYFDVKFNVVEKRIVFNENVPEQFKLLFNSWFDKKIKVNGFEGHLKITLKDYNKIITQIENGKKIEININVVLSIKNEKLFTEEKKSYDLNEYSTITGRFSLKEVDDLAYKTQLSLIKRFNEILNKN